MKNHNKSDVLNFFSAIIEPVQELVISSIHNKFSSFHILILYLYIPFFLKSSNIALCSFLGLDNALLTFSSFLCLCFKCLVNLHCCFSQQGHGRFGFRRHLIISFSIDVVGAKHSKICIIIR